MLFVLGTGLGVCLIYAMMKRGELSFALGNAEALESRIDTLGFYISQLKKSNTELRNENSKLRSDLNLEKKYCKSWEVKNSELDKKIINLKSQLLETEKMYEEKITVLNERLELEESVSIKVIKELEKENKELNGKVIELSKNDYKSYLNYILNSNREVKRAFLKGELLRFVDKDGTVKELIVEEV